MVPVVGDLAGQHALAAIGGEIEGRGGRDISFFYTSNVEFYLVQDRSFHQYARTVAAPPLRQHQRHHTQLLRPQLWLRPPRRRSRGTTAFSY